MTPFRRFGRTPWTGDRYIAKPVPTQDSITQKWGHTSMPRAGFEPIIPVFERPKTIRVLTVWLLARFDAFETNKNVTSYGLERRCSIPERDITVFWSIATFNVALQVI
jgi:hypothetical protein